MNANITKCISEYENMYAIHKSKSNLQLKEKSSMIHSIVIRNAEIIKEIHSIQSSTLSNEAANKHFIFLYMNELNSNLSEVS